MLITPPRKYVRDRQGLDEVLAEAKQMACPHCHRTGMLVGHGVVLGYAERSGDPEVRGRRLLCSARFRRSGCGRTFAVLISTVIGGFVVRTRTLSSFLEAVVGGLCRKAAWEQVHDGAPGLSLRSGYRLWTRLLAAQSRLRTILFGAGPPPPSTDARPIAQLLAHLRCAAGADADCVFAGVQLSHQRSVFG
jgi:hypothetical protein